MAQRHNHKLLENYSRCVIHRCGRAPITTEGLATHKSCVLPHSTLRRAQHKMKTFTKECTVDTTMRANGKIPPPAGLHDRRHATDDFPLASMRRPTWMAIQRAGYVGNVDTTIIACRHASGQRGRRWSRTAAILAEVEDTLNVAGHLKGQCKVCDLWQLQATCAENVQTKKSTTCSGTAIREIFGTARRLSNIDATSRRLDYGYMKATPSM